MRTGESLTRVRLFKRVKFKKLNLQDATSSIGQLYTTSCLRLLLRINGTEQGCLTKKTCNSQSIWRILIKYTFSERRKIEVFEIVISFSYLFFTIHARANFFKTTRVCFVEQSNLLTFKYKTVSQISFKAP